MQFVKMQNGCYHNGVNLNDRKLCQFSNIVVKIAEIHLTPCVRLRRLMIQ